MILFLNPDLRKEKPVSGQTEGLGQSDEMSPEEEKLELRAEANELIERQAVALENISSSLSAIVWLIVVLVITLIVAASYLGHLVEHTASMENGASNPGAVFEVTPVPDNESSIGQYSIKYFWR